MAPGNRKICHIRHGLELNLNVGVMGHIDGTTGALQAFLSSSDSVLKEAATLYFTFVGLVHKAVYHWNTNSLF